MSRYPFLYISSVMECANSIAADPSATKQRSLTTKQKPRIKFNTFTTYGLRKDRLRRTAETHLLDGRATLNCTNRLTTRNRIMVEQWKNEKLTTVAT